MSKNYAIKCKRYIKDQQMKWILHRHNYIQRATSAARWIDRYSVKNHGIVITSKQRREYQEVTGYYIPTLLQWGFRERAFAYAGWLCEVQGSNGAWKTSNGKYDSVFNTGQVLRGLASIHDILPEIESAMLKGADWLIQNIDESGRMRAIDETLWDSKHKCSELIHLYCLPPLILVSQITGNEKYSQAADRAKEYYIRQYMNDIQNFKYLSHFYAYVLEALVDLGKINLVKSAMEKVAKLQGVTGAVPAYIDKKWICSTGLFQFAIIWFKLGDLQHGNRAFDYACALQNPSGGWYGSYPSVMGKLLKVEKIKSAVLESPDYFPNEEISWAVKYFFDALYYRQRLNFELRAGTFISQINQNDWKYQTVSHVVKQYQNDGTVLDVGCGKGRYLLQLNQEYKDMSLYGVDISKKVLGYIRNKSIDTKVGSVLAIPYKDESMDVVLTCEALEHAILIPNAVHELTRVVKEKGTLIVIDKSNEVLDEVKYEPWFEPEELSTKQYFGRNELKQMMEKEGLTVEILQEPKNGRTKGIYTAWIGRKIR